MKIKLPLRFLITLCFFAVLATAAAQDRPVYGQCDDVTDQKLANDIIAKIKNDKSLASQLSHINVSVTNKAVKFQGWADSKKDYDRVVGFATDMNCVRVVNVNDFHESPPATDSLQRSGGGCGPGTKPCGEICIPETDACNIP
jgi:BON domain